MYSHSFVEKCNKRDVFIAFVEVFFPFSYPLQHRQPWIPYRCLPTIDRLNEDFFLLNQSK